jgi:ABC-type multidrug transport system fused ATPase/permease subunit
MTSDFRFNVTVEDNSTAVFMQCSIKNYVRFITQVAMGLNITVMLLLTLVIGDVSIYNYIFCVILYYLIMHYTNELIVEGYIEMLIVQCKRQLIDQEVKNIFNNKQVSLLYEPTLHGEGGIPIDFKDVTVKLCGKKVLEIPKLHIGKGEIIGITGTGSHLITSVLFKLLKPSLGVIFIGTQELNLISQENVNSLIAVVPFDLQIKNMSIL